jgi:hypothetical protein
VTTEAAAPPAPRLPRGARTEEMVRAPVRLRGGSLTLSAWRLHVASEEGPGTITLVEQSGAGNFWRGDGVFLGWSAEELATAWEALLPRSDEPELQLPPVG